MKKMKLLINSEKIKNKVLQDDDYISKEFDFS